jgi:nucleotide-binding universal stress UspA family protein
MLPIHTILHPTDFSERSALAFRLACALARDYGARLVVLHVTAPPLVAYGEGVVIAPTEAETHHDREREELRRLRPADPKVVAEHLLLEGDPVSAILGVAQDAHVDLIVMGTHGRTGLRRLLMGSVAEQVVRRAPCPVLTVRTPFPEAVPSAELHAELTGA